MAISVSDLLRWAEKKAIGRSTTVPNGWISGEDISELAGKVLSTEPLNYSYRDNPELPPGHCFTVCECQKCGEFYEASYEHICRRKNSWPKSGFDVTGG